jgi:peptidoglycan/LPS O-acetylase OafA/YrhL
MTEVPVGGLESAAQPKPARVHFPCFDGFRAIAAFSVLVTHVTFISRANRMTGGSFFARMDAGVAVFFVISGFLLYRPFAAAHLDGRPGPATRSYLRRRFLRIFPAYWFATLVIGYGFGIRPVHGVKDVILHFGLLHIYTASTVIGGPVTQAWTLATEISFYVFLPVYAALLATRGRTPSERVRAQALGVGVLYVAGVLYRYAILRSDVADAGMYLTWLPGYFDQFALGMGLAVASVWFARRGQDHRILSRPGSAGLSWGLAALAFTAVSLWAGLPTSSLDYSTGGQMARQALYGLTGFFLVLPGVFGPQERGLVRRLVRSRPLQLAGLVSYGIYLWHESWIDRFLRWFDVREFGGHTLAMLGFVTACTLAAAAVSYLLVEKPALRLKDRQPTRRRVLASSPT